MTIYTQAKTNSKMLSAGFRIGHLGGLALLCAAFPKCCTTQCQTPPGDRFSGQLEAISPVYLGLGVYGHGPCLNIGGFRGMRKAMLQGVCRDVPVEMPRAMRGVYGSTALHEESGDTDHDHIH
jgi:hypothetical protein